MCLDVYQLCYRLNVVVMFELSSLFVYVLTGSCNMLMSVI